MTRRRRRDLEESRPFWRGLPHHYAYAALGALMGLLSPLGAFLLRFWLADPLLKSLWVRNELQYNSFFYAYMALGTGAAFTGFGYVLGLRSERQRVSNRMLSARVDELHLKSVTDALSGAYTYGYLYEVLELEIQRTLTERSPLSLLILDVDDFKRINDSHGHSEGDRALRVIASALAGTARASDIVCRYGGEEFCLILPGTPLDAAAQLAERIREEVPAACAGAGVGGGARVSVTIGLAACPGDGVHGEALMRVADRRLYRGKEAGRDRVVAA